MLVAANIKEMQCSLKPEKLVPQMLKQGSSTGSGMAANIAI